MSKLKTLKNIWTWKSFFIIPIALIVPISFLLDGSLESRCAYVVIVMAILWLTESLPISVTALIPVFLLPMLEVQTAKEVSKNYVNDTSMLFLGGLIVAVAMEEVNLHRRIALAVTMLFGSRVNMLMLGLMLPTWFLSMWISNTASASMMLPIISAVTAQMESLETTSDNCTDDKIESCKMAGEVEERGNQIGRNEARENEMENLVRPQNKEENPKVNRVGKALALSVAYAANIGGVATLTGSPPNLVLQGQADSQFKSYGAVDSGITFANWMAFGVPLSLLMLLLAWVWLQMTTLRCGCCEKMDSKNQTKIKKVVRDEYKKLGSLRFGEIVVMVMFVVLAMLWIFRDLPDVGGWGDVFIMEDRPKRPPSVSDSTPSILVAVLLFVLPSELPHVMCRSRDEYEVEIKKKKGYQPILTWEKAEKKVAWGVIILLGGGFALADATSKSGLSKQVGCALRVFSHMSPWVMNMVLSIIVAAATEITSNTATATLLMPILFELALASSINPLYLMISCAAACSFAFMLPVATPPNAIVFSTKRLKIFDMASVGLLMNLMAIMMLTMAINTWGAAIFDLTSFPSIFVNATQKDSCSSPSTLFNSSVSSTGS